MAKPELDLVICGGEVLDGTGRPGVRVDVGVHEGWIVAIGDLSSTPARLSIDAEGLVVAPGFIDMHAHSDIQLLVHPQHEAKVSQGVTTELIGQDGLSYAPVETPEVMAAVREQISAWNGNPPDLDWAWRSVADFLDRLSLGVAVNVAYLAPHGTIRLNVMGFDDRAPTQSELAQMKKLVAKSLDEGAFGLSAGLTYAPGMFADDLELVELCRVVADYGGLYCPHHRNYGSHALEAYDACLTIARQTGVALHLPHTKMGYEVNRGRAHELISLIDEAQADGVDVTYDSYPYIAGSTYLAAFAPRWLHKGGPQMALQRLKQRAIREDLRVALEETGSDGSHGVPLKWSKLTIAGLNQSNDERYIGRTLADIAADELRRPIDVYCDLLIDNELAVSSVYEGDHEENVQRLMQHPSHMIGSDGILVGARPHPRGWGTFPRYLGRYVRELSVLTLEECVRQMTSLPAQRLGLRDRGVIAEGMRADLVCFDPNSVRDTATFDNPRALPVGIPHVFVNGTPAVMGGVLTGATAGAVLRSTGMSD